MERNASRYRGNAVTHFRILGFAAIAHGAIMDSRRPDSAISSPRLCASFSLRLGAVVNKQFDVGLVVTSKSLSLSDLARRLGRQPQAGSHGKGTPRTYGTPWAYSVWRENSLDGSASLEEQCLQLVEAIPRACRGLVESNPEDVSVFLDIAVYFETAYASIKLRSKFLAKLATIGIDIDITAYPAGEASEG